ncbi:MAG: hypothetical protein EA408_10620, partial [Marinilabiliales bacterium]
SIAGFGIVVFPERGYSIEFEPGWKQFIKESRQPADEDRADGSGPGSFHRNCRDAGDDILSSASGDKTDAQDKQDTCRDVEIFARAGIPDHLTDQQNPVFVAENEVQRFFSVYRHGGSLRFLIYSQPGEGVNETIQQVAIAGKDFSRWEIYSEPGETSNGGGALLPLQYPLGPLIMYYLTVRNEAIMIHASGVHDGQRGRLFTGFSGAGKSTISGIWREAGSMLINDDRLIIRKRGGRFLMYNTPMFYEDVPREAPLDEIYLISHSPVNKMKRITGATAVTRVLAHCIQNNYDKGYIENHLTFLGDLCSRTDVFELGFVPDGSVVDFVSERQQK